MPSNARVYYGISVRSLLCREIPSYLRIGRSPIGRCLWRWCSTAASWPTSAHSGPNRTRRAVTGTTRPRRKREDTHAQTRSPSVEVGNGDAWTSAAGPDRRMRNSMDAVRRWRPSTHDTVPPAVRWHSNSPCRLSEYRDFVSVEPLRRISRTSPPDLYNNFTLRKKLSSGSHKVPLTENRTVGFFTFFLGGGDFIVSAPLAPKTLF